MQTEKKVVGIENAFCERCESNVTDSNEHLSKMCSSSKEVMDHRVCSIIHKRLKEQFNDFENTLNWNLDIECPRQKTVAWLAVQKHPKIYLLTFKKSMREFKGIKKKKFKMYLVNI